MTQPHPHCRTRWHSGETALMKQHANAINPDWAEALELFTQWLQAANQAPGTIYLRRWWLTKFAAEVYPAGPWGVTCDDVAKWAANTQWSPNTRKIARASIRRFFYWARATGRRSTDPTQALLGVRIPPSAPRPAPARVLMDALEAADGCKQRLMLLLAAYGGLRRAEISRVHADDVDDGFLLVTGKGERQRWVPIHDVIQPFLNTVSIRGGWAFPGRFDGHCSADHVGRTLSRLLGPGWTGHTLRHRFATETYHSSHDLRAVQELLGHASVATTQIYVGVDREALRKVVANLASPAA